MNPYNTRVLDTLAAHLGADQDTILSMALDHYTRKINALHIFGKPKGVLPPARLANGPHDFAVESFTAVPKSNIHNLIVASESGDRFAFQCGGSDWPPLIRKYAPSGQLKLICYGGRPTKFVTDTGSFPLDPIPLPF